MGVRDRFSIIISTIKFVEKHNLMKEVKAKVEKMGSEVQKFKEDFNILFEKGLPYFWDKKGKLLKKEVYVASLKKVRQDNSKFQSMEGNFKGKEIIDKLGDDLILCISFK